MYQTNSSTLERPGNVDFIDEQYDGPLEDKLKSLEEERDDYLNSIEQDNDIPSENKEKIYKTLKIRYKALEIYIRCTHNETYKSSRFIKLFDKIKECQDTIKKCSRRLGELGVILDEENEEESGPELKRVFITFTSFEPLNEKLTEFVNNPENTDSFGFQIYPAQFKKIIRQLRNEHGDNELINHGIPINNNAEYSSFILEQIQNLKRYVSIHRWGKPFLQIYSMEDNKTDDFVPFTPQIKEEIIDHMNVIEEEDVNNEDNILNEADETPDLFDYSTNDFSDNEHQIDDLLNSTILNPVDNKTAENSIEISMELIPEVEHDSDIEVIDPFVPNTSVDETKFSPIAPQIKKDEIDGTRISEEKNWESMSLIDVKMVNNSSLNYNNCIQLIESGEKKYSVDVSMTETTSIQNGDTDDEIEIIHENIKIYYNTNQSKNSNNVTMEEAPSLISQENDDLEITFEGKPT